MSLFLSLVQIGYIVFPLLLLSIPLFLTLLTVTVVTAVRKKTRLPTPSVALFTLALLILGFIFALCFADSEKHLLFFGGRWSEEWITLLLIPCALCAGTALVIAGSFILKNSRIMRGFAVAAAVCVLLFSGMLTLWRTDTAVSTGTRVATLSNSQDEIILVRVSQDEMRGYRRENTLFLTPLPQELQKIRFRGETITAEYNGETYVGTKTVTNP